MKRFFALLLSAILILAAVPAAFVYAASDIPPLEAEAYVVMDMRTGSVLASKNADEKLYPASLTKMITAMIAMVGSNFFVTRESKTASKDSPVTMPSCRR